MVGGFVAFSILDVEALSEAWEVRLDTGAWKRYEAKYQKKFSQEYQRGNTEITFKKSGMTYKVDLDTKVQTNMDTKTARPIRVGRTAPLHMPTSRELVQVRSSSQSRRSEEAVIEMTPPNVKANVTRKQDKSLMWEAVRVGDVASTLSMLEQLPERGEKGRQHALRDALADASGYGHGNLVSYLLQYKAEVNAYASRGRTALHEACMWDTGLRVVEVLLNAHANPNLRSKSKKIKGTAIGIAQKKKHQRHLDILLKAAQAMPAPICDVDSVQETRSTACLPRSTPASSPQIIVQTSRYCVPLTSPRSRHQVTPHGSVAMQHHPAALPVKRESECVEISDNDSPQPPPHKKRRQCIELKRFREAQAVEVHTQTDVSIKTQSQAEKHRCIELKPPQSSTSKAQSSRKQQEAPAEVHRPPAKPKGKSQILAEKRRRFPTKLGQLESGSPEERVVGAAIKGDVNALKSVVLELQSERKAEVLLLSLCRAAGYGKKKFSRSTSLLARRCEWRLWAHFGQNGFTRSLPVERGGRNCASFAQSTG